MEQLVLTSPTTPPGVGESPRFRPTSTRPIVVMWPTAGRGAVGLLLKPAARDLRGGMHTIESLLLRLSDEG